MVSQTPLERYRRYLDTLDAEAQRTPDEEDYLELLSPGEVIDLLCTRDEVAEMSLDNELLHELDRLDDLLTKHYRLIPENVPAFPDKPSERWWWHLHDGPQVRDLSLKAS